MFAKKLLPCLLVMIFMSILAAAQSFVIDLPLQSQRAEITQRVGITDITIRYSRPLVNGRKIWDGLVLYGQVWRTGANANTTVTFSDPVTIEGQRLDRGTYGLHTIPNRDEWTIIFSRNSTAWGSFTYDESEDALRVKVKPQTAEMHPALTFEFDQLQSDSATVELKWEKIAVPFKVAVDVHGLTRESIKTQLRTLARFTWMSWNDAANYLLAEKIDLETALTYADKSIEIEDRYDNEITKWRILEALGRREDAVRAQKRAIELASPLQINRFARELLAAKRTEEAFALFRENARKNPNQWFVHDGLARMYSAQGKFDEAIKETKAALAVAPDVHKNGLNEMLKRLELRQDINK